MEDPEGVIGTEGGEGNRNVSRSRFPGGGMIEEFVANEVVVA